MLSSACFTDGNLPVDMEASELLSDTFDILSSKEIKLLAMRAQACKDLLEEDDMALANVVMQEAQMKIISQVCAHSAAPVWVVYLSPGAVLLGGFRVVVILKSLPLATAPSVGPNVCLLAVCVCRGVSDSLSELN